MKTKKKLSKARNVRSEAAMREAHRIRKGFNWSLLLKEETVEVHAYLGKETFAIFDIRDCFRKRQPLKGIKKAFNKAIQPKKIKK